jgi:mono/diheme cytochrome c family protein
MYQDLTGASEEEMALFERAQLNLPAVGGRVPLAHGLDTSLAQVGLSLARRLPDEWATRDAQLEVTPRESALDEAAADSKPAVWWTIRYKTRWLSDASIVSGNPIFTNFLWNEIGRGTDLRELDTWLDTNGKAVDELTVAVFNTPAPRWTTILPDFPLDIESAKRGEAVFETNCSSCHGHYEKGWSEGLSGDAGLETTGVRHAEATRPVEVGTDPLRAAGMGDFAEALNDLVLSQQMETVVEVQSGYVPPPLDGIWARFPYLHNGSVPSLCALLSAPAERPATFVVGPADDPEVDFNAACVGLPAEAPESWSEDEANVIDTTVLGLGNQGHDFVVSGQDQVDLIEFLKTL